MERKLDAHTQKAKRGLFSGTSDAKLSLNCTWAFTSETELDFAFNGAPFDGPWECTRAQGELEVCRLHAVSLSCMSFLYFLWPAYLAVCASLFASTRMHARTHARPAQPGYPSIRDAVALQISTNT